MTDSVPSLARRLSSFCQHSKTYPENVKLMIKGITHFAFWQENILVNKLTNQISAYEQTHQQKEQIEWKLTYCKRPKIDEKSHAKKQSKMGQFYKLQLYSNLTTHILNSDK